MSAKTDLENAFSILDAGISAHVTALRSSKAAHAITQAVANDDTYLQTLTTKVLSWADQLAKSVAEPAPVTPVDPVTPPAAPAAPAAPVSPVAPVAPVTPAVVPATPVASVAPQALVALPVVAPVPVAPAVVPVAPAVPHQPSVLETMRASVEAMLHNTPK